MSGSGKTRRRTICMAPSVELWQPEASHMGNIAEQMIARDYLKETRVNPLPLGVPLPTPTVGEFIDTGSLAAYKKLLALRHPLEVNRAVLESRNDFKIPDMSTWQGEYRERTFGVSHLAGDKQGARSENYEIKPDNVQNAVLGQLKLARIAQDNTDLGLTTARLKPGYVRGEWYPPEARRPGPGVKARKIPFSQVMSEANGFKHRLLRWEKVLSRAGIFVKVRGGWLDVVRRQPGLLQYKICFNIEMDDDATEEFENALAAKLVRLLYEHLTLGLSLAQQKKEVAFVDSLRTLRATPSKSSSIQDPKVAELIRQLDAEATFGITFGELVDELKPLRSQLREVMVTRNRGIPGEYYFVCCDHAFLRQEVTEVRRRIFERNKQMLRGLYGPTTPDFPTSITLARAGVPLVRGAPLELARASAEVAARVFKWVEAHPKDAIIAAGVVIVLTASVVVVVATAGAAAPLAVPLAETLLLETSIIEAADAALVSAATSTVTVEGTLVTVSTVGASVTAGSEASAATLTLEATLAQQEVSALAYGLGARQAGSLALIALPAASTSGVSDEVLTSPSGSPSHAAATQGLSAKVLAAAIQNGGSEESRNALFRAWRPEAINRWRDSIINAGATVAAISSSQLVTTGVTSSSAPPGAGVPSESTIVIEMGNLHIVKVRMPKTPGKPTLPRPPALEQEFDCATFSNELQGRFHYLGYFLCD